MADRTSAEIFSEMFKELADGRVSKARKIRALKRWNQTALYDFHPCQMDCEDALIKLGLCEMVENPEDPDDYHYLYGPEGEREQ